MTASGRADEGASVDSQAHPCWPWVGPAPLPPLHGHSAAPAECLGRLQTAGGGLPGLQLGLHRSRLGRKARVQAPAPSQQEASILGTQRHPYP